VGVEIGIGRLDGDLTYVTPVPMPDEARLEKVLEQDIGILGLDVMLIGRQLTTAFGKRVDLLAITAEGDLVVIELKRDRTPREIVAQVLD
jgi:RecB family endonuclease NucS